MSTMHTPGPWHWVNSVTDEPFDFENAASDGRPSLRTVAEFETGHVGMLPIFILDAEEVYMGENARLIAAAPDLLAALLESSHGEHKPPAGEGPCRCSQCRFVRLRDAAIAKATVEPA